MTVEIVMPKKWGVTLYGTERILGEADSKKDAMTKAVAFTQKTNLRAVVVEIKCDVRGRKSFYPYWDTGPFVGNPPF